MRQVIASLLILFFIVGCTTQNSSESSSIPANVERAEADIVGLEGKAIRSICLSGKLFCSGMQTGDFKGYADSFCMSHKPKIEGLVAVSRVHPGCGESRLCRAKLYVRAGVFCRAHGGDSAFVHLSDHGIQAAESLALASTMNIRDCLVLQESEGTWKTASFGLGLVLED